MKAGGGISSAHAGLTPAEVDPAGGPLVLPDVCEVVVTRSADATTALLCGDLESSCAREVERALDDELQLRPVLLEVSLERLTFMDSSGLRVFLLLQRNAEQLGVPLRFVRPRGPVRRTLEFAKALDYLGIDG